MSTIVSVENLDKKKPQQFVLVGPYVKIRQL